jgi:hypothetical protein
MKKSILIIMFLTILFQGTGLNVYSMMQQDQADESAENDNDKNVVVGRNFIRIAENDTSVNIKFGNRKISILESLEGDGKEVRIGKYDSENDHWYDDDQDRRWSSDNTERRRTRFRGNWSGIEVGFNNYTASRSNHMIPDAIDYMTLHSGKSHNFNLNFAQVSLGITKHIGFVTGLGLNWNNYRFDGDNNITKGEGGQIEELNPGSELEKSKLTTVYLNVPVLLELHLPGSRSNHLNIAAGPIGGIKLLSHSKMVYEDRHKVKSNSDFNLSLLRIGGTARVGYSNIQLFGTYYLTPLFRTEDGPGGWDLYPFEVGLAFTFNN